MRAYDLDGAEIGEIHLPAPVLVGDVAALEHGPGYEVVSVLHDDDGTPIAVTLRPVRFHAARR